MLQNPRKTQITIADTENVIIPRTIIPSLLIILPSQIGKTNASTNWFNSIFFTVDPEPDGGGGPLPRGVLRHALVVALVDLGHVVDDEVARGLDPQPRSARQIEVEPVLAPFDDGRGVAARGRAGQGGVGAAKGVRVRRHRAELVTDVCNGKREKLVLNSGGKIRALESVIAGRTSCLLFEHVFLLRTRTIIKP